MKKIIQIFIASIICLPSFLLKAEDNIGTTVPREYIFKIPATVYSKFDIEITTEVKGVIIAIIDDGSKIKKGATIAKLDDKYEQKLRGIHVQHENILNQKIRLLKKQVSRYEKLASKNIASKDNIENKKLELLTLQQQKQNLSINISKIEHIISKKTILADYDGVILDKKRDVGETVFENTVLLRVLADKSNFVKAFIPAGMIDKLNFTDTTFETEDGLIIDLTFDFLGSVINVNSNTVNISFKINSVDFVMPGKKGRILFKNK